MFSTRATNATRRRLTRAGIAAVALAPAIALTAPGAVADEAEQEPTSTESSLPAQSSDDSGDSNDDSDSNDSDAADEAEGSLPDDIDADDVVSSLTDTDWKTVASILSDVLGGTVSSSTILDIITLANGGEVTVGDVIGSVTGSLGDDSGSTGSTGSSSSDAE